MIVNLGQSISDKFSFNSWQNDLAQSLIDRQHKHTPRPRMQVLDMGRGAGHTYLARAMASSKFPLRTKVYTTNHARLGEYADLIFHPERCHEVVDVIPDTGFAGYGGTNVDVVVVDMASLDMEVLRNSLQRLCSSISPGTWVLVLEPVISV